MNVLKMPFFYGVIFLSLSLFSPSVLCADEPEKNAPEASMTIESEPVEKVEEKTPETLKKPNKVKYKKHQEIPYLIITSNYEIPYLLVAAAQKDKNIPYLLIPADTPLPSPETVLTFNSKRENSHYSMDIQAVHLSKFIAYLRPRNVIILGDDEYVSEIYRMAVPSRINRIEIDDSDWKINVLKLANQIHSRSVYKAYANYMNSLKNARKTAAPAVDNKDTESNTGNPEIRKEKEVSPVSDNKTEE